MSQPLENSQSSLNLLEQTMGKTCFCKLRETCPDKTSSDCFKERNIYKEFMQKNP